MSIQGLFEVLLARTTCNVYCAVQQQGQVANITHFDTLKLSLSRESCSSKHISNALEKTTDLAGSATVIVPH